MTQQMMERDIRKQVFDLLIPVIQNIYDEALFVASNEIAVPCVDAEGEERWFTVKIAVPRGNRDGTPYDGYEMAEDYNMKLEEDAEKERARQAKRDAAEAERERKRKLKAAKKKVKNGEDLTITEIVEVHEGEGE